MISIKHYLKNANLSIDNHYGKNVNGFIRSRELIKMMFNSILFRFETKEYYYYSLSEKTIKEKREFLAKYYQAKWYYQVNTNYAIRVTSDKWTSYKLYEPFYQRDAFVYNPNETTDADLSIFYKDYDFYASGMKFLKEHNRFFVKPLDGDSGIGAKIVESTPEEADRVLEKLKKDYTDGFIAEELIKQSSELEKFHPKSVNTLRIQTIYYNNDRIEIIYPCLRMGRGGAVIDNANSGGLFAAIDRDSGITIAASDELGRDYYEHPDTKLPLVGINVPHWKEACELSIELAKKLPECKIIGWDLALTDKGWVLVEINSLPLLIYQIASHKGIRREMEQVVSELLKEKQESSGN